jgi:hypothetical protein
MDEFLKKITPTSEHQKRGIWEIGMYPYMGVRVVLHLPLLVNCSGLSHPVMAVKMPFLTNLLPSRYISSEANSVDESPKLQLGQ